VMIDWTHILIHHSASRDTSMVEAHGYRKYHMAARGWLECGYHAVTELAGAEYITILARPLSWRGSHCKGMNSKAIGVCLAGDFTVVPPPIAQQLCAARHVAALAKQFGIPIENIQKHSDYRATECPGRMFNMDHFKLHVERYMQVSH